MQSIDYIAGHVANITGVSPQQVANSAQKGFNQADPYVIEDEGVRFEPMDMAVEQGQKAIVSNMQRKAEDAKRLKEEGRFAQAVAEAMRPKVEVGHIKQDGSIEGVPIAPETVPESRETIKAGIDAVGLGGRKGVFSELPFEAEDIPDGWEVIRTQDGGYLANPKENTPEVLQNESSGERHKTLGYKEAKPADADRVVQVRTPEGHVMQDVAVNLKGQGDAIEQALDVAGQIKGSVDIVSPQDALAKRTQSVQQEVSDTVFDSFSVVEGARPEVYKDSQGLRTVGVGFNMEQVGAERLWTRAGIQKSFDDVKSGKTSLDKGDMKSLLNITIGDSSVKAQRRAESLGIPWDSLPEWHRSILTDIAFNTGSVTGWSRVFNAKSPREVLRQARRLEGGKHTSGMDNRVARIGIMLNIINTVKQAKDLGLSMTNLSTKEVVSLIRKRSKAQPTI